jgi:uncharacterized membrane protein (Fun14 family)
MSEVITPVVYQLGLGAVGGFIVGFALKKGNMILRFFASQYFQLKLEAAVQS